jgi:hypothetical protein
LIALPLLIGLLLLIRVGQTWWLAEKGKKEAPFFISDVEQN